MKTRLFVLLCLVLLTVCMPGFSLGLAQEGPYLGQPSPGLEAEKFAPGIISVPQNWEQYPMWSPDGLEFYYDLSNAQWGGGPGWQYTQGRDGLWTDPVHINRGTPTPEGVPPLLTQFELGMGPTLSADGRRVYVMANQSVWMSEREGDGWSQPRDLEVPVNPTDEMWWISATNDGTIFLTLGREATNTYHLYRARPDENGRYLTLENMAGRIPYQNMFFHHPAPDESYIILSQWNAAGTFGGYDLYITFRDAQDNWTAPRNLGPAVNTGIDEMAAFVTADQKYLFYNTRASSVQNADIYWIEVRAVLPDPNGLIRNLATDECYGSIQCAIDYAGTGDTLVLEPGLYRERLDLAGKNIVLQSVDPTNPCVTEATVIRGDAEAPVIRCSGSSAACRLRGLSVTGGRVGLELRDASPHVEHCRIVENIGAGIEMEAKSDPLLSNTLICANGGAAIAMTAAMEGRWPVYNEPTLVNCTVAHNATGGLAGGIVTLRDCIVWGNGSDGSSAQLAPVEAIVRYSCVEGGFAGEGNIDAVPRFLAADDYHLHPDSACIDAGDPADDPGPEPTPNGNRVNLGAYGGTLHATRSLSGMAGQP
jgi:hypothetical protein